ncbi:hypothetical protein [Sphingobium sp.]|uniref:hypothetical protein n=1 Tax=Sphingobium sp. TaxID=1912891 RepID=UPI000DB25D64|nr:hypothetical protein [Sphingobium sp.]PZU66749.1 MAG: hypothetical protein DI540_13730 [Sphingobium sp.]
MTYFAERVLTEELAEARTLLKRALAILDDHDESDAAYSTCEAIERLVGAPTTLEQWYMMTGRRPSGEPLN